MACDQVTGTMAAVYLTLTSTAAPATDLGYLLHKHPDRAQRFELSVGIAHVFYPEATTERCTVALLLEVDPVGIVRGKRFGVDGFTLGQYVNDRPYAASSLLAVALGRVFGTAMAGRCAARPDLEGAVLPLEIHVPALPSGGGPDLLRRLFAPLGWAVEAVPRPLDPDWPDWGDSRHLDVRLRGDLPLDAALSHLYVLLPVLDGAKHYWVGSDEVDKLVRTSGAWLGGHPERDLIAHRYLAHQRSFVTDAVARLAALETAEESDSDSQSAGGGDVGEPPSTDFPSTDSPSTGPGGTSLAERRRSAVLAELRAVRAARVVDLGCGEGALLRDLLVDPAFTEIVGADVSARALDRAAARLRLDRMPDAQRARLSLLQSSLTYRDTRLAGYDAIVLVEVVEHLDPARIPDLERTVFGAARPGLVVITTPNAEHNVRFPGLPSGQFRHPDHRFEWTRAEFAGWADRVAEAHGYTVEVSGVGDVDAEVGAPSQLAVFRRAEPTGPVR